MCFHLGADLDFSLGGTDPVTRTLTLASSWGFPFSGQGKKVTQKKQRIRLIHLCDSPQYPIVNMVREWQQYTVACKPACMEIPVEKTIVC